MIDLSLGHLLNGRRSFSRSLTSLNSLPGEKVVKPWAAINFGILKSIDLSNFELNEAAFSENSNFTRGAFGVLHLVDVISMIIEIRGEIILSSFVVVLNWANFVVKSPS